MCLASHIPTNFTCRRAAIEDKAEEFISNPDYAKYNIYYQHTGSVDDALGETITADIFLIPIVVVLIFALSTALLTRRNLVESKGSLAIWGSLLILLALATAYGLGAYLGIPLNLLSQVKCCLVWHT